MLPCSLNIFWCSLGPKITKKLVHKHVHNFVLENNIITPFQSGFTRGDSTVNQLVDLYNTFCHALDEGKEVRVVFCDISKAFDRVWHRGLLAKLYHYGITGNLHKWFDSYLSNRFQRVTIPGGFLSGLRSKPVFPKVPFSDRFCSCCISMILSMKFILT